MLSKRQIGLARRGRLRRRTAASTAWLRLSIMPTSTEEVRRSGCLPSNCNSWMTKKYTAKDITVLEGLEPVRKRPGMYIGGVDSVGLHHLLWELLDNSVDEAMNGHCDKVT